MPCDIRSFLDMVGQGFFAQTADNNRGPGTQATVTEASIRAVSLVFPFVIHQPHVRVARDDCYNGTCSSALTSQPAFISKIPTLIG